MIDRSADGYVGISAEEFREAMLKDQQDMNFENPQPEDMEISFTKGRLESNGLILPYFAKYTPDFLISRKALFNARIAASFNRYK